MPLSTHNKEKSVPRQPSPKKPSLIINAISNYASLGLNIIVGFLLTPFIINHIGKTGYGIWTLIASLIGYYGLVNLGVRSAITRYVALYAGQGNRNKLNTTASTAMAMFGSTCTVVIVVSFLIAPMLAEFFKIPTEHFDEFKYMVWILGIATGLSFPSSVFSAIIIAHERFVPRNYVIIATTLIRAGLVVCLLISGYGLIGVAFATLGSQLFGLTANYLIFKYFAPGVKIRLSHVRWHFLRKLVVYGSITTVITTADHVRMNIDSLVIGKWLSMDAVGVYGIAALLTRYMGLMVTTGMGVLMPRFTALHASNDDEKIKEIFVRSLHISAFLAFGCCMLAIIFGGQFITLWVGKDFADSTIVLWILSFSFAFDLSQTPGIGLMYALKKHRFYAIATTIEAIANITLSILLVTKYGIIGVAMGTAISMLIVKILVQPVYVSRIINISILDYAKPVLIPLVITSVMVIIAYSLNMTTYDLVTIPYLICFGTITCFLYILVSFLLMNKNDQKFLIHRILKRKLIIT